jgi:putative ABC transport system substrate-binding protein
MATVVRIAAGLLLLTGVLAAYAQQAAKMHRIGFVSAAAGVPDAFRHALRELEYIEGKNLIIEMRAAQGRQERLPELVAEVLQHKIDVLVVGSTLSALAAKRTTTSIPVVFASVFDPVASGIVPSLARPGGNITGAAIGVGGHGFAGKWVELLKQAAPYISHIAVLSNRANPASSRSVQEIHAAARTLNVKLDVVEAGNVAELDKAFAAIRARSAQGIIVTNDPFFSTHRAKLVQFASSEKLPAMYFFKLFADSGGLMAYGPSTEESWKKAAAYVDKILKGAKPADLPVEQSTKFELVINLRAAKALGLTFPQSLLLRADEVIER